MAGLLPYMSIEAPSWLAINDRLLAGTVRSIYRGGQVGQGGGGGGGGVWRNPGEKARAKWTVALEAADVVCGCGRSTASGGFSWDIPLIHR